MEDRTSLLELLGNMDATSLLLILVGVIVGMVLLQRVTQAVENYAKKRIFNNTPKDRREEDPPSAAHVAANITRMDLNNGGLQRAIGGMATSLDMLNEYLRDHHKEDLGVSYDIKRGIEKLNEDEQGRHERLRKTMDEMVSNVAANTLETKAACAKIDALRP